MPILSDRCWRLQQFYQQCRSHISLTYLYPRFGPQPQQYTPQQAQRSAESAEPPPKKFHSCAVSLSVSVSNRISGGRDGY